MNHLVPFVMAIWSQPFLTAYSFEARRIRGPALIAGEGTFGRLHELLESDHGQFSKVVLIGSDARIESLLAIWFDPEPVFADSDVRVFRHRG